MKWIYNGNTIVSLKLIIHFFTKIGIPRFLPSRQCKISLFVIDEELCGVKFVIQQLHHQ